MDRFMELTENGIKLFRSSSASVGLKTSSLIGRVARYTPSSTYALISDILQNPPRPNL